MRWVGLMLLAACTFGSAGGGSASVGETSSVGDTTSSGTTSSPSARTGGDAGGTTTAPPGDATTRGDGSPATTTGRPGDETGDAVETCNGVDDDGDGAVDEFSPVNDACGPCRYEVGPHLRYVYSFCSDPATQPLAELNCDILGATLASIGDDETNDFLFDNIDDRSFIGYTDDLMEGVWYWTNAAPLVYEKWAIGEPNDAGDGQDCAVMRDVAASWDDVACNIPHAYICRGPL